MRRWVLIAGISAIALIASRVAPSVPSVFAQLTAAQISDADSAKTIAEIQLAADRMMAARPFPSEADNASAIVSNSRDAQTIRAGLTAKTAPIRAASLRAIGRFENAVDVPAIAPALNDSDPAVRREAANALAQAVYRVPRGAGVLPVRTLLASSLTSEKSPTARSAKLEAIARLRYDHQTAMEVAPTLVRTPEMLVIVARQDRNIRLAEDATALLRRLARPDDPIADTDRDPAETGRPRWDIARDALEALFLTAAADPATVTAAISYHCPIGVAACGWEIRYLAVQSMDVKQPVFAALLDPARHDVVFQVREAAIRKIATIVAQTQICQSLLEAARDPQEVPIIRLDAISALVPGCAERAEIEALLVALSNALGRTTARGGWQLSARAFETLVRFNQAEAKRVLDAYAVPHVAWQVRAAAARVAATMKDESVLLKLADDKEANVRTEVVKGLGQIGSAALARTAIKSLESPDHQLVRESALALKATPETAAAIGALLAAEARLTKIGKDNSRDARIAIWDRLKEFAKPGPGGTTNSGLTADVLRPYLQDYDPSVAAAAADTIQVLTGTRPTPAPTFRPVEQPTAVDLMNLPSRATVALDNGDRIDLQLLTSEAPLTISRFVKLINAGYYNDLTFHRVDPLFVIQGGSPGANEYSGDARFLRDEIGLERHPRGAVGTSTRGRDTGDAQFFVDLTDQMRLNYIYTVFARVVEPPAGTRASGRTGMGAVDAVLEGARIVSITLSK